MYELCTHQSVVINISISLSFICLESVIFSYLQNIMQVTMNWSHSSYRTPKLISSMTIGSCAHSPIILQPVYFSPSQLNFKLPSMNKNVVFAYLCLVFVIQYYVFSSRDQGLRSRSHRLVEGIKLLKSSLLPPRDLFIRNLESRADSGIWIQALNMRSRHLSNLTKHLFFQKYSIIKRIMIKKSHEIYCI